MPGKLGALIALEAGAGVKASSEIKGFRPESIISHYQHVSRECRLSDYLTYLIFNYFTCQSGCVFRSERAPIGIRNGTIRSSYVPSLKISSKSVNRCMAVMHLFMTG
jgi:hypothetical protein